jgi:hypothetical protein
MQLESAMESVLPSEIITSTITEAEQLQNLQEDVEELRQNNRILESIIDEDENLWRALSDWRTEFDLPLEKQHEQMQRAWSAYCTNPIAFRQIQHITNFVTGEDLKFISPIPEVAEWINDFWRSPQNQMPLRIREYSNGFCINGNVFFRFYISKITGKVAIREIAPHEIKEIIHDPDDVKTTVYFKREFTKHTYNLQIYEQELVREYIPSVDVIRNPNLTAKVKVDNTMVNLGQPNNFESYIYHLKTPTVSGRKWGMTLFASHLYWLREYKNLLRHIVNLNKARSAYVMDVTVKGTERDVMLERRKHRVPPSPGSVLIHTDRVTYEYKGTNTGSANTQADLRAIKLMSVAGSGLPEHIVTGDASNANYSSTRSTNYPFIRMMQGFQEYWKYAYLYGILWTVLWAAAEYGPLSKQYEVEEWDDAVGKTVIKTKKIIDCIEVQFPQLDRELLSEMAAAFRVYGEMGIVSRQTMCIQAGFDWSKEKPRMDKEQKEANDEMMKQQQLQQGMQQQIQQSEMEQQAQMMQLQGDEDISQAVAAKHAGVPEASQAMQKMVSAQSGGMMGPGGMGPGGPGGGPQQQLMQSKDWRVNRRLRIIEDRTSELPPRILSIKRLLESKGHNKVLRTRVLSARERSITVREYLEQDYDEQ